MTKAEQEQHKTLYRAYRPQTFAEVRGQEAVVKALQGALKNKRIAHAYLFAGGRGTGKTSIARIFARELGVTDKDLFEMDAASHNGVDDIREIREGIHVSPFESPYKCYIIDEAHMLSKAAWNALLKTIEEPPAHALFIFATTDMHKVPDTVLSRSEVYNFKQPTREILVAMIQDVAKSEGFSFEKSAAELVALLAEGSFRDALSILQKVLTVSSDKKVDISEVELVTDAPKSALLRDLVAALANKKTDDALKIVRTFSESGVDMRTVCKLLITRLRSLLLLRYAPELSQSILSELSEADAAHAKEMSAHAMINSQLLKLILEAYERTVYAAVPQVPLELAIIESAS